MTIRVGIGGWTYEPWRETFYPKDLPHARELEYASRQLTAIEVNGTFYRTQSASSFAKWRDETPEDFVFALKGHRAAYVRNIKANPRVRVKVGRRWYEGTARILEDDDPRERMRMLGRTLNDATVRLVGTEHLTIRVDLDAGQG